MARRQQVLDEDDFSGNIFTIKPNTHRNKRKKNRRQRNRENKNLTLKRVVPITDGQQKAINAYFSGQNLLLHGMAGTGKTFIAMYLGLADIEEKARDKTKLVVVRSVVPTREVGFLPGGLKEKISTYELPYKSICSELYGRSDAYEVLKQKNILEFTSSSFIRGTTLENCVVFVDECQNMNFHELDSIVTRVGKNAQIIFSGDFRQSDLRRSEERRGIHDFMNILKGMTNFAHVEYLPDDIVRSAMVKEYIIEKPKQGYA